MINEFETWKSALKCTKDIGSGTISIWKIFRLVSRTDLVKCEPNSIFHDQGTNIDVWENDGKINPASSFSDYQEPIEKNNSHVQSLLKSRNKNQYYKSKRNFIILFFERLIQLIFLDNLVIISQWFLWISFLDWKNITDWEDLKKNFF